MTKTELVTPESVAQEAHRIVNGSRREDYNHPLDNFSTTALIWEGITGYKFTPDQVGLMMIGHKLAREAGKPKRDNLTDICGYACTVEMVQNERERRAKLNE